MGRARTELARLLDDRVAEKSGEGAFVFEAGLAAKLRLGQLEDARTHSLGRGLDSAAGDVRLAGSR